MYDMIYPMYELTIFKNQFDNKTHKRVSLDRWDKFVSLLYGLSKQKGEKGGNNSSPLILLLFSKTVRLVVIDLLCIGVLGVLLMWMTMHILTTYHF